MKHPDRIAALAALTTLALLLGGCGGSEPDSRGTAATSRAQAHELERSLDGAVLWLAADCCGTHAVDDAVPVAVGVGHALIAADGLRRDAPVFVTGSDQRVAAIVADRIEAGGMSRVFLVTD